MKMEMDVHLNMNHVLTLANGVELTTHKQAISAIHLST